MSNKASITFRCVECENSASFGIYYIRDGVGIRVDCDECGAEQVFGEKSHE